MKASARAILVTDKPCGVDFHNVVDIVSPADDPGYLHQVQNADPQPSAPTRRMPHISW